MTRYETRDFSPADVDEAATLLAERHRRQRLAWPALNPAYGEPSAVRPLIESLLNDGGTGAFVRGNGRPLAYVLGIEKDAMWGPNVWIEAPGSAADDPEALRHAYAHAAKSWVAAGRTNHFSIVPASDEALIESWFSLSFGMQHVHAVREPVGADFRPAALPDVTVREATEGDVQALLELDPVLPNHARLTPVFARPPLQTPEEALADIEDSLRDPRYTNFVAEHGGRVVGGATACSLELSNTNTAMMRPVSCGFLGWAAVLPEARGLGVGRALSDAVLAWSRDHGYEWVATDWRSTNLDANRSWTKAGYRPTFYRVARHIA